MPPSARISASPTLAAQTPIAPASMSLRAQNGLFPVFMCGRMLTSFSLAKSAIALILDSAMSRSTMIAGVSRSSTGVPGSGR